MTLDACTLAILASLGWNLLKGGWFGCAKWCFAPAQEADFVASVASFPFCLVRVYADRAGN